MEQTDRSPLKRFVLAKKKIGEVFEHLLVYVQEGSEFVAGMKSLGGRKKHVYIYIYMHSSHVCVCVGRDVL